MPVLELAAGRKHERELGVGLLVRRYDFRRHELAAAILGRKAIAEHDVVAGLIGRVRRIGAPPFPPAAFPGKVVQGGLFPAPPPLALPRFHPLPITPTPPP